MSDLNTTGLARDSTSIIAGPTGSAGLTRIVMALMLRECRQDPVRRRRLQKLIPRPDQRFRARRVTSPRRIR